MTTKLRHRPARPETAPPSKRRIALIRVRRLMVLALVVAFVVDGVFGLTAARILGNVFAVVLGVLLLVRGES